MTVGAVILAASEASALDAPRGPAASPPAGRRGVGRWRIADHRGRRRPGREDRQGAGRRPGHTRRAGAPRQAGPVGQIVRGIDLAVAEIDDTDAALIWPARMVWVGPETVTSLIEAHGLYPGEMLRPSWDGKPGWPALLPVGHVEALRALPADRMPDDLLTDLEAGGVPTRLLDLGDPGHDVRCPHDARGAPGVRRPHGADGRPRPRVGRRGGRDARGRAVERARPGADGSRDGLIPGDLDADRARRLRRVPAPLREPVALHDGRPRGAPRRG